MRPSSDIIHLIIIVFSCRFLAINAVNYEYHLSDIISNEGLDIFQLAKKYKYPLEVHKLITEDGYTIEMHRIAYGHDDVSTSIRPAVLLTPGIAIASEDFVSTGNKSLALTFSEAGYDVWIYNSRGTKWSRSHVSLTPDDKDFWMFSWHEIGVYDYSACIDYITNLTKQDKIFYIGYSQGATSFAVLTSERPEYNQKIRLAILMGTSIYTTHNKHALILYLAKHYGTIKKYLEVFGIYEFPSNFFRKQFCAQFMLFCKYLVYVLVGYNAEQIDENFIPVFVSNPSGGFSMRVLEHYAQIFTTKKFRKLDYGLSENLVKYGSEDPPNYDLSKITAPVAFFCGLNDPFSTCDDITELANDLPNVVLKYIVPYEMWTHVDFLFGRDAQELVYKAFLQVMQTY